MNKHIEKIKKQLIDISEVVNSFKSEAVQAKIIEKLLDYMIEAEKADAENSEPLKKVRAVRSEDDGMGLPGNKKPGATKVLNQLLSTDYFNSARSISSIADYCKEHFDSDFKTSELSGILLKLSNEHKLKRERSKDNNRFEYVAI